MKLGQLFFLLPLSYALDITNYPNALAVLGNGGPAGEKYPDCMGLFVQTGATHDGVPVWSIQLCGAELCLGLLHTRASKSSLVTMAQPEGLDWIYLLKNLSQTNPDTRQG